MRIRVARVAGIMGLTGLAASVLALAGGTAATAGTADTGGTARITIWATAVAGLARAGIVVLPAAPGTAVNVSGRERINLEVTGGDADYVTATGHLSLAGSLVLVDGATGRTVTLSRPQFSYDTAQISGVAAGHGRVSVVSVGGALSATTNAGPPPSQSFSASALIVTKAGASYLDKKLGTTYFKAGSDIGEFSTTYDTQATG